MFHHCKNEMTNHLNMFSALMKHRRTLGIYVVIWLLQSKREWVIKANPPLRCGPLFFGLSNGVCLLSPTILWNTMRMLCLHLGGWGVNCDISHRIGEKVFDTLHVWASLKNVDVSWRDCDIPHKIEKKVPNTIYVWVFFNCVDLF